jgi:sodium/potassium/calcium exchanger 6
VESLVKRSKPPKVPTPECREVHAAEDQCAFVKKYCRDDDAGLLPYLDLYYCKLGNAQPVAFVILVLWLGLLFTTIGIAASDFFSVNLSTIATILRLSESLAGVTFLAFGNGSPDVFSTFAAMASNSTSMALGELLGAACFISGAVAGSMALVREFKVDRKSYARDICFFIVAIVFTMIFLADGHLHFWECCAMIGYYVLYVITVVGWHWYFTQRKQRLRREGEARSHYYGVGTAHSGDELAGEPYRDDPDDVDRSHGQQRPYADITTLESGAGAGSDHEDSDDVKEDEADLDHERMVAAEVARSMRVLRTAGKRKNTITPIRPSLVGALEFRSALAQLQRESNLPLSAMPERSRSLTHLPRRARRETTTSSATPANVNVHEPPKGNGPGRARAASHGNAPISRSVPHELLVQRADEGSTEGPSDHGEDRPQSPTPSYTVDGNLAPPPNELTSGIATAEAQDNRRTEGRSRPLFLQTPSRQSSYSDQSSPNSPFPHYTDSPMLLTPNPNNEPADFMLPSPVAARRQDPLDTIQEVSTGPKPVKWWPYSILPPPHVLLATLFPTLQGWMEKTVYDKFVSAISVPSIFMLVMTLPVVEPDNTDEECLFDDTPTVADDASRRITRDVPPISVQGVDGGTGETGETGESEWQRYRRHSMSRGNSTLQAPLVHTQPAALENEETLVGSSASPSEAVAQAGKPVSDIPSVSNANDETAQWNRWLVCVQLFTGPLFAVFVLWANMAEDMEYPTKELVKMMLYTLLTSLVLLGLLILFTVEHRRPRHHYVLCFMGFVISIAWISTIAGEVVGVLKTFGVVLDISEALLGLTIFAAGNSVGDLVADITVARLGYPVMAL